MEANLPQLILTAPSGDAVAGQCFAFSHTPRFSLGTSSNVLHSEVIAKFGAAP